MDRRGFLLAMGAAAAAGVASGARAAQSMTRAIPKGKGELLPAVGLGSWQAFDVEPRGAELDQARDGLARYIELGGRVVDTSPMYGRAETALGALARELDPDAGLFMATKIWTAGRAAGERQLAESLDKLARERLDLVQVHNLLDADAHLMTIAAARERGAVRYAGVTHYTAASHDELARYVTRKDVDFLQVNYSIAEPEAEKRLLGVAAAHGVAVLVNRPFAEGAMFERVKGRALPPFAEALGCRSAAQLFLKWILANRAVTCVLCGTRKRAHIEDNLAAAREPLPTAAQRARIAEWFSA